VTVSEPKSIRATARELGIAHPTLLKAIEQGRIREAVLRDADGRVVGLDAACAAREWDRNRSRPTAAERRPAMAVPAPVVVRLNELISLEWERQRNLLAELVPDVVSGARETLRAVGHQPTSALLADALSVAGGNEDAGFAVICGLHEIVEEGATTGAARKKAAQQLGREVAMRWCERATEVGNGYEG
jgi:hypothetical protein